MTFTLESISIAKLAGGRTEFRFSSDEITRVDQVGIAIRDADDNNLDLSRTGWFNVGPDGFTYISDPLPADLDPGDYTAWASIIEGGLWKRVGNYQYFTVEAPTPPPAPGGLVPGKTVVFDAPFSDTTAWTVGKTSSYPGGGSPQYNSYDNKLDRISPTVSSPVDGVFNATRHNSTYWNADLVTTEYVPGGGFEMLPGDTITADITLGGERGAWPALWTWGRDNPPGHSGVQPGHGEVDFFEYHTDNPNLLELSNRTVSGAYHYYSDPQIQPGVPFALRVDVYTDTIAWHINGQQVWEDGVGVPSYWRAWLIVNLSVSAGQWHPKPLASQTSMQYAVDNLRVWR